MSDLFAAEPYPFEERHNHGEAAMKVKRDQFKYKAENAIPCPFCGGESVSVNHSEVRYLGQNAFGIKKAKMRAYCVCNKCKARGTPVFYIGYINATRDFYDEEHLPLYSCGDKAIEKWNERQPVKMILERLEEKEEQFFDAYSDEDKQSFGSYIAMHIAVDIVKEEGGIDG